MSKNKTKNSGDLNNNLKRLSEIAEWFENREGIDIEEDLKRVKEAVKLIKTSRARLKEVENEFEEIEKEVKPEENTNELETPAIVDREK